jgi:hypothetical protein
MMIARLWVDQYSTTSVKYEYDFSVDNNVTLHIVNTVKFVETGVETPFLVDGTDTLATSTTESPHLNGGPKRLHTSKFPLLGQMSF